MKQLIAFFTPSQKYGLFDRMRTSSLIILGLVGVIGAMLIFFKEIISTGKLEDVPLFMAIFIIGTLFFLKKYGIRHAGNIFSTGLVMIMIYSISKIDPTRDITYKFIDGYYNVILILAVGVIFASRTVFLINFGLVLLATTRIYIVAPSVFPESVEFIKTGYFNHTFTLIFMAIVLTASKIFADKSIDNAEKDAKIKDQQNKKLNDVFSLLKNTTDGLNNLSGEISNSANSLNSNSADQASNVEEITATIEEITTIISENASTTNQTSDTVKKTNTFVQQSGEIISNTRKAILNINEKIAFIKDIAFQTNILALNAAIEAARAGEAGRGFSVVAQEVKKLAEMSNEGAKQISEVVEVALSDSDQAEEYQNTIMADIQKITEVVENISKSSIEQQAGAEQINLSIFEVNTGAQNNASISEQLNESVSLLAKNAQELDELLKENAS